MQKQRDAEKDKQCYVFELVEQIPNCGNYDNMEKCETIQNHELEGYNQKIKELLEEIIK